MSGTHLVLKKYLLSEQLNGQVNKLNPLLYIKITILALCVHLIEIGTKSLYSFTNHILHYY